LALWLKVLKAGKKKPKGYAAWEEVAKLVAGRVEKIYKEAAAGLIECIGEYCSYCESRITGLLEVEHVLPKAQYPTFSTDWDNFLFACSACNIAKTDNPLRTTVLSWISSKITNENQCLTAIRNRYRWPDTNADSYRAMPVELLFDQTNKGNWQSIALADAADLGARLVSVDVATRTARADFPAIGLNGVRVIARVEPAVVIAQLNGKPVIITANSATEMIAHCGLNTTKSSRVAYDRRGLSRTRAWFGAVDTLRDLDQCPTQADFNRVWRQVGKTAAAAGFFSVWVRVFSTATDKNGNPLDARFVNDFAADFPGTNPASLP